RKSERVLANLTMQRSIVEDFRRLDLEVFCSGDTAWCCNIVVKPTLLKRLKEAQEEDP
ncbi:hypothetical protein U1Q18_011984, partial [Sarracenia purpurea var. burkii]